MSISSERFEPPAPAEPTSADGHHGDAGGTANARVERESGLPRASLALYLAWLVALVATLGALLLGEVLGRAPCTLCWYQRIAMFPLALVLGIACLVDDHRVARYALPLALAGAAVALYHTLLYTGIVAAPIVPCSRSGPSCTDRASQAVAGMPLPMLSLGCFATISVLLVLAFRFRPTLSTGDSSS